MGKGWSVHGCKALSVCDDIAGGWFMWALRDAVAAAGHYASGPSAADYYRRLAREINAACADHNLDCEPERASLMPSWRGEYARPLSNTIVRAAIFSGPVRELLRPPQSKRRNRGFIDIVPRSDAWTTFCCLNSKSIAFERLGCRNGTGFINQFVGTDFQWRSCGRLYKAWNEAGCLQAFSFWRQRTSQCPRIGF